MNQQQVSATYVAGIGWMFVTETGRHGGFDGSGFETGALALKAGAEHVYWVDPMRWVEMAAEYGDPLLD